MDFALVVTVLLSYFIRPQDWVPGMSGLHIMNLLMAAALLAMFFKRRGFEPGSLIKTPIDWAVLAYGGYIILSSPSGSTPFSTVAILLAYYAVTSQALDTPERLHSFLRNWMIGLLVVAAMAVLSEYGLDLTHARKLTHANPEEPRLVLNTYHFNNPNALGHSIVTIIPLAYMLLFWRKSSGSKLLAVLATALAILCVYMTKSKGAYIVGFVLVSAIFILGRPLLFQVIALLVAATLGLQGLKQMPRMGEMDSIRRDEAVMGRMIAWEKARTLSKEHPGGIGFKNYEPFIPWEGETVKKATHSSYVLVGAELGTRGMFFYLAVLFACLRVLMTTRCENILDETSRRAMFLIVLGYMASGWLIDRSYHLEYFFIAGAVSAFHRRFAIAAKAVESADDNLPHPGLDSREFQPPVGPVPVSPGAASATALAAVGTFPQPDSRLDDPPDEGSDKRRFWRRWGWLDLVLVLVFTRMVFLVWDRVLENYFY